LRKSRYLEANSADSAPDAAPVGGALDFTGLPNNGTTSHEPASAFSGRSPAPAPPNPKPAAPAGNSIFGAKLQEALHDERK
jgi:hypothetical protein